MVPICPLCLYDNADYILQTDLGLDYFLCPECDLRYLHPNNRLSPEEEKLRYLQHENNIEDSKYQAFVRPLYDAVRERSSTTQTGLDFGAGTGPVMAALLEADGYQITRYDPHFWPDKTVLQQSYNFVYSSEVVEHLYSPLNEFKLLRSLIKPDGFLAIMTWLYQEGQDFENWSYRKDPTHVVFYSQETFKWIREAFNFKKVEFKSERVIILEV